MSLNGKQIISIILAVLGVLMISTTQLTDLVGPGMAKTIVSLAALLNSALASIMAVISSNSQQFKDVSNTIGIEPLRVNAQASPQLAALAMDPKIDNIAPTRADVVAVEAIAKGA